MALQSVCQLGEKSWALSWEDLQTDGPTKRGTEAPGRSLKMQQSTFHCTIIYLEMKLQHIKEQITAHWKTKYYMGLWKQGACPAQDVFLFSSDLSL